MPPTRGKCWTLYMASLKALVLRVRPSPTPPNSVMEMFWVRNPNGTMLEHDTVSASPETNQQQHRHSSVKQRRRIFGGSDWEKRRRSDSKRALSEVKGSGFCYVVVGESIKVVVMFWFCYVLHWDAEEFKKTLGDDTSRD